MDDTLTLPRTRRPSPVSRDRVTRAGLPDSRLPLAATLIAALGLAVALAWGIWHRGPWYDDFYSWFVTDPGRTFADGLISSWLVDNHPPLFYVLVWITRHASHSIESARQINLVALAAGLLGSWFLIRDLRPERWIAAIFLLVIAANPATLEYGTELRSYLVSLIVSAVVILALTVGWLTGTLDRAQRIVLAAGLLTGFNVHILTSVILGAATLPFIAAAWFTGRRQLALAILWPALIAGAIFVGICLIQIPLWWANTTVFWIPKDFSGVRWSIELCIEAAITANPVALVAAIGGGALLCADAAIRRTISPELAAALLLGLGIVLASALLAALQLVRPMVIERYLAALIAPAAMTLALGFSELVRRVGRRGGVLILAATLAATGWALVRNTELAIERHSWLWASSLAARVQRHCADTPIHIDPPYWNAYSLSLPPRDNHMVMKRSYALVAGRLGLRLEPSQSRRIARDCPTLFWAEHDVESRRTPEAVLARLREQGFAVDHIWMYRQRFGWIASNRPLSAEGQR
ncbi:hypothetical protein B0I00_1677 [Novosphingobium kunmingense]|uniref:Dolichyl-phosphate-mannose-protein mannosyltransferase n=1 Tax=Novosphingobium kunmingense TaxID=1211806 RepID=A0A2N0HKG6_9SPHN|nr:hypothetical protein B0I00_1677 [Novosphingobium kunmingense]